MQEEGWKKAPKFHEINSAWQVVYSKLKSEKYDKEKLSWIMLTCHMWKNGEENWTSLQDAESRITVGDSETLTWKVV